MPRASLLVLGLGISLMVIVTAPAAFAQDGPMITVEPTSIEAAGDTEFTVTGSGFTAPPPLAIVPCFDAATPEALAEAGVTVCDTGLLSIVNDVTNGAFATTVTFAVPEAGMCIIGTALDPTETAESVCISVRAAQDPEDGGEQPDPEIVAEGDREELAETGRETVPLAIIAVATLGGGAMAVRSSRRFS